ncbi:hypothetical protein EAH78_22485 [Pseudomonas arsenicoxydans]|uniref:Uncharacterized protein n=1 Tax=Pseudomonas arsenicoxydans TaxID=702115 RepID=A0A502HP36_9PSED|nr:hypothetical protein EAH78_22485 [Pseudomonas arsenicoxydans]
MLAKAIYHSTLMSTDTPLSRASPLPHLISCTFRWSCHCLRCAPTARASLLRSTTQSTSC